MTIRTLVLRSGATLCLVALTGVSSSAPVRAEESAGAQPAYADTSKPVTFLKETVVTGARYPRRYYESPQALSFLSRGQLRDMAPLMIGDALQQKITELVTTGKLKYYDELKASVPAGLVAMLEIPSLGPKKIIALNKHLGVDSIEKLEAACITAKESEPFQRIAQWF